MFEPVHGSAPDIAGKGIANPVVRGLDHDAAAISERPEEPMPLKTPSLHRALLVRDGSSATTETNGMRIADLISPSESLVDENLRNSLKCLLQFSAAMSREIICIVQKCYCALTVLGGVGLGAPARENFVEQSSETETRPDRINYYDSSEAENQQIPRQNVERIASLSRLDEGCFRLLSCA